MKKSIVLFIIFVVIFSSINLYAFAADGDIMSKKVNSSDIGYQIKNEKKNYEKIIGTKNFDEMDSLKFQTNKMVSKSMVYIHRAIKDIEREKDYKNNLKRILKEKYNLELNKKFDKFKRYGGSLLS